MPMKRSSLAATVFAAAACLSAPAFADGMPYRGSAKDAPIPVSAGPCYFRADVGYSWSNDPSAKFTQTAAGVFVTDAVSASLDNTWLVGAGLGCGSGPRGIRGELMFDWHGSRDLSGTVAAPQGGTVSTNVKTYTLMFNGYYDLGQWDRFVPYVGAGVGFAHNTVDDVTFSALNNRLSGDDRWSLAWSLMAGVGWQVTDRVTLDLGYRYLDMGKAESGHIDTAGFWNPKVRLDDLTAHEIKFGLRFAFGGGTSCCAFMK